MWIHRPREYHELFLGGSLGLFCPSAISSINLAAEIAWRRLRFEVPELVLSAWIDDGGGRGHLDHQVTVDGDEVSHWVGNTLLFSRLQQPGFEGLKQEVLERKGNHDSYQACLLLHVSQEKGGNCASVISFILNAHHQITDGIGIRILLGKYLSLLSTELHMEANSSKSPLNWADSAKNLSVPWITIMNKDQAISGSDYEREVAWNQEVLTKRMVKKRFYSSPSNQLTKPRAAIGVFLF